MQSRPNIVLLTCHDLGRYLGCYGRETVNTPNLDALAANGILFQRAFSTSSGCSPSRASIATGRYPHNNGVLGLTHPPFGWGLNSSEKHMATLLQELGYQTHLFGFQHVAPEPDQLGFYGLHCGEDEQCSDTALGCDVLLELDNFLEGPLPSRPMYLEINLEEPHRPYDQGGARPEDTRGVYMPPYLPNSDETREEMAAFQGALRQADGAIGSLLEALERSGVARNCIVIFMADHGIAMPRAKCTLYDAGIGISLIISWSGSITPGSRGEMISSIDLLPTLMELLDAPVPPNIQGRSFCSLLHERSYTARSEIYAEKTWHSYYDPMRAVRTERFKLIRNFEPTFAVEVPGDVEQGAIFRRFLQLYHNGPHVPVELYDLENDPFELENLVDDDRLSDLRSRLDSRLWSWMQETSDPLLSSDLLFAPTRRQQPFGRVYGEKP